MAIKVNDNFSLKSALPNFERDVVNTYADLIAGENSKYYTDGAIVYCKQDKSHYYLDTTGTQHANTKHWQKLSSVSGGSSNLTAGRALSIKDGEIKLNVGSQVKDLQEKVVNNPLWVDKDNNLGIIVGSGLEVRANELSNTEYTTLCINIGNTLTIDDYGQINVNPDILAGSGSGSGSSSNVPARFVMDNNIFGPIFDVNPNIEGSYNHIFAVGTCYNGTIRGDYNFVIGSNTIEDESIVLGPENIAINRCSYILGEYGQTYNSNTIILALGSNTRRENAITIQREMVGNDEVIKLYVNGIGDYDGGNPRHAIDLASVINSMMSNITSLMPKPILTASVSPIYCKNGTTNKITVSWTFKLNNENVTPDSIDINNTPVTNTLTNYPFNNVTATTTYKVSVVKDGTTYEKTASVTFINPKYCGAAKFSAITASNITTLTEILNPGAAYTMPNQIELNDQKIYYAYPASYGALTDIKDLNEFPSMDSFERTTININIAGTDVSYYVYSLKIEGNNPAKFKFIKQ